MKLFLLLMLFITPASAGVLHQMESSPGQDKEEFLLEVASWMQRWTKANDVETCGLIIQNEGVYAVILETQTKRTECLAGTSYKGWRLTGENIHSHPAYRVGRMSLKKGKVEFSDTDYETPGYLVANGFLFYQCGKGTERKIGVVEVEP